MIIIPIFIIIMVVFVIKDGTNSDMSIRFSLGLSVQIFMIIIPIYIIIMVIFIVKYGTNFDVSSLLIRACQSQYLWLLSQYLLFYGSIYCKIWFCLCWGFTAQSTQWGHVERGQFT